MTFQPGDYIIDNGKLAFNSGAKVTGDDVLFYLRGAQAGFEIVEALDPFVERAHRNDEMWLLAARKPDFDNLKVSDRRP